GRGPTRGGRGPCRACSRATRPFIAGPARSFMPTSSTDQTWFMKAITDAADGFDELAGVPELLPQALDVHVDGAFQYDGVLANRGIHELIAGEGPARLPDQDFQQPELGRGQR